LSDYDLKGKKVALPREFMWEWLADNVRQKIEETIEILKQNWVQVDIVDLPLLKYAVSAYYVIMPAESSTNLSRFDWLRFWLQDDSSWNSIFDYYKNIRSSWFGEEVQRRILLWTYILWSENYESYFLKAQTYRQHLKASFDKVFADYDLIIWPTSPTVAWKIWEKVDDPVAMYLADNYTIVANLLWLPAMSLPVWFVDENWESLPVWFQMMANNRKEWNIFWFANQLEQILKKSS
jgi:aspartyl-tRNA(Asn)/glutamyl-tRNA(Gln) amidotransferase subunit A